MDYLKLPAVVEVQGEVEQAKEAAEKFRVVNAEQYRAAGEELVRIKGAQKRLEETRKGLTKPLDESKKRIMDLFRPMSDALAEAEAAIRRGVLAYTQEQERLRREEQRKADEIARKERERLERLAAEERARAEAREAALRAQAEKANAAQRAKIEARLKAEAEKAEAKQAMFEERADAVQAPVIQRTPPKVEGVSTRKVWKFRVVEEEKVPRQYLVVDEAAIRRAVQARKGDTRIPGVEVWEEESVVARS